MNLNTFRIFLSVYESKSMTKTAADLHLTQSGISQHIHTLEEDLGFALFERANKKLIPTLKASTLYARGKKSLTELESALTDIRRVEEKPSGLVRIGLPIEFGNNVVIPKLAALGIRFGELNFDITMDFATVLSDMVLRGELDMALIDRFRVHSSLKIEPVATEMLQLCGLRGYVDQFRNLKRNSNYYSKFAYVDYKADEPIVRSWFRHHLHRQNIELRVRAHVFDVQGIAKFITGGLGCGVLPDHVVAKLRADGVDLHVFEEESEPLKNDICLIHLPLKDRTLGQQTVMECLRGF